MDYADLRMTTSSSQLDCARLYKQVLHGVRSTGQYTPDMVKASRVTLQPLNSVCPARPCKVQVPRSTTPVVWYYRELNCCTDRTRVQLLSASQFQCSCHHSDKKIELVLCMCLKTVILSRLGWWNAFFHSLQSRWWRGRRGLS